MERLLEPTLGHADVPPQRQQTPSMAAASTGTRAR
jgi:hypothetical protein